MNLNYWKKLSFERKATALFVLFFVLLAISPAMGIHNNYVAYDSGTHAIMNAQNPYPTDWKTAEYPFAPRFLYSPSFAYFFLPFSTYGLGAHLGTYAWVMLNFSVFMAGVWAVFSYIDTEDGLFRKKWFLLAILLLANEMMGSLTNLQSNGFISGATLLATGLYMRKKPLLAAFLFAMVTNFKIFPLAMVLLVCLDFNIGFILLFAVFSAAFFLLPLLSMDSAVYGAMIKNWFEMMANEPTHTVYLGLEPTLMHYGFPATPSVAVIFTLANAGALALASLFFFMKNRSQFIRCIVPAVLCFIILFNKRSESQSFIIIVPVFGFMLHAALSARAGGDHDGYRVNLAFLTVGWLLISWIYSDLAPKPLRQFADQWHFKTMGAVILYLWAWGRIAANGARYLIPPATRVVADSAG